MPSFLKVYYRLFFHSSKSITWLLYISMIHSLILCFTSIPHQIRVLLTQYQGIKEGLHILFSAPHTSSGGGTFEQHMILTKFLTCPDRSIIHEVQVSLSNICSDLLPDYSYILLCCTHIHLNPWLYRSLQHMISCTNIILFCLELYNRYVTRCNLILYCFRIIMRTDHLLRSLPTPFQRVFQ